MRIPLRLPRISLALGLLLGALATCLRASPPFQAVTSTRHATTLTVLGNDILIGTTGGLVRVLPEGSSSHRAIPLLPGARIWGTSHDVSAPEALLLATSRGLYRYLRGGLQRATELPTTSVLAIPSRETLLTGHPNGVVRWLKRDGTQRISRLSSASPVFHLAVHHQRLYAGNGDGLWSFDSQGERSQESLPAAALTPGITWLGTHGSDLLVGTPGGLFRHRGEGWEAIGKPIHVLGCGSWGEDLLVGTEGDGTWILRGKELEPFSHEFGRATCFADRGGHLLVGTRERGVLQVDPRRHLSVGGGIESFYREENEPPENHLTSLAWDETSQTLFVGGFEGGLARLREGRWRAPLSGLPSPWINHLACQGGRLLVRVSNGQVAEWKSTTHSNGWSPLGTKSGWPKDWTASLGVDRDRLWVGSLSAFYLSRSPGQWQVFRPKPALDQRLVLDVAEFAGRLWVATHRSGLISLDPRSGAWEQISLGTGLSDSWVTSLEVFGGALWAGTFQGGLLRLRSPELPWENFRRKDSPSRLPSNAITALHATDQELWVGTLEGLVRTDGEHWQVFGVEDGLADGNVTALASSGLRLWVAGPSGLSQAFLQALRESPEVAREP